MLRKKNNFNSESKNKVENNFFTTKLERAFLKIL